MSHRMEILEGMADALWRHVSPRGGKPPAARTRHGGIRGGAPMMAARDLADLYEDGNDASLEDLLSRSLYSSRDATAFGQVLARAALGAVRLPPADVIKVPRFSVWMEKDHLVWDGDIEGHFAAHPRRVNPRDWDRDGARGYGRYAYRMGRMLSQALADARKEGVPERLMGDVQDGWAAERADLAKNPKRTKTQDYTMHDRSELEGKPSHSFESAPHTKSLAEVRQLLARRRQKCHRDCPGWAVFETVRGDEIQVCDECNTLQPKAVRLSDDDVAQLPEAQKALREVVAEDLEENPRSTFFFRVAEHGDINVREVDRALSRYGNFVDASGRVNRGNIEAIAMANGYAGDVQVIDYIERRARARAHQLPGRPPGVPNGRRR